MSMIAPQSSERLEEALLARGMLRQFRSQLLCGNERIRALLLSNQVPQTRHLL